ncbi:hypothetical protein DOTSEDRAFT_175036 [Dothistroma septosporum NZE10]|uniref:Man(5)GlcNAc(2)-PP-dolichol translocation protein RFT1 n=1 Tax=Dothistroma septosporum (strain NZE10 / CBS 128990) TaxID=675120 RepID=N1PLI3_DOTSN|nr:hypothetical protein DOTSEDRAFT_175036 [Dothistroma septosporum NZE10]
MATDAVSSSAGGVVYLILSQIISRGATFILNQGILRYLSPSLLGVSVQLELYVITVHHFARECLRVATQRRPEGGNQAAINLSYLAICAGLPITLLIGQYWRRPDVLYFEEALQICGIAAMVELLSEPAFVAVQQNMLYSTRAKAEAYAVAMKTVSTAGVVFYGNSQSTETGALPFAAGELAYCATLTLTYVWKTSSVARHEGFSLLPIAIKERCVEDFVLSLFPKSLLNLSFWLYFQEGIKYFLNNSDVLASIAAVSLEDQGNYAISTNYGGLIARMVFRPIEDSSRNLFARLCSKQELAPTKTTFVKESAHFKQAASVLGDILRVYNIISLIVFAVGPSAAPLLLRLVAGSRWSDSGASEVLGTYCYSIPLLAINGVSEAFVAATATPSDLFQQSFVMGGCFAGFAGSAYFFLQIMGLGAKGLVFANCVNMGLRVVYNLWFVRRYFAQKGQTFDIAEILPRPGAMAATVVMPTILSASLNAGVLVEYGLLGDLIKVGAIGGGFALFILATEYRFFIECYRKFRS